MDLMKKYNEALEALYDHVGYTESLIKRGVEDMREYYWRRYKNKHNETIIVFTRDKDLIDREIHLIPWAKVYYSTITTDSLNQGKEGFKGEELTMFIVVAPIPSPRIELLAFYDNQKEVK